MINQSISSVGNKLPVRIAIINLTGGGMSGGYKKYLINVLPRIASNQRVEAVLCVSPESLQVKSWFKDLSNVTFVSCDSFRLIRFELDSEIKRHLDEFSPSVILVPLERFFRYKEVPVVNLIQNMEPMIGTMNDNPLGENIRLWIQYYLAKKAIKKASRIISLSKFVSDFLVTRWGIKDEKIKLIYHGIDERKNTVCMLPHTFSNNFSGPFIFTAGSIRPARGLKDLLLAIKQIVSLNEDSIKLVIAGEPEGRMLEYRQKLINWIKSNDLSTNVIWAGKLNENEMAWCYKECSMFVMTSRVESFGMIGGEAMSHGCICIAANNPCLPELFENAAVYYPPKDSRKLAEEIQTVLSWNDNQRNLMSKKAIERAELFSWDMCAEKTVIALEEANKNDK